MSSDVFYKPDVESFVSPFFFFANSPQRKILYVSPSIEDVLGYKPADVIGRNYREFLEAEETSNQGSEERNQVSSNGFASQSSSLCFVTHLNGRSSILKVQTTGKVDSDGNVIACVGIAEDITEDYLRQVKANQRLKELSAIETNLSSREISVLKSVINGRPNKSIARQLDVTERAVEMIRARLVKKFCVKSTAGLVSRATELQTLREMMLHMRRHPVSCDPCDK